MVRKALLLFCLLFFISSSFAEDLNNDHFFTKKIKINNNNIFATGDYFLGFGNKIKVKDLSTVGVFLGKEIEIEGENGDIYCYASEKVIINGNVRNILIFGKDVVVKGKIKGEMICNCESLTVEEGGYIKNLYGSVKKKEIKGNVEKENVQMHEKEEKEKKRSELEDYLISLIGIMVLSVPFYRKRAWENKDVKDLLNYIFGLVGVLLFIVLFVVEILLIGLGTASPALGFVYAGIVFISGGILLALIGFAGIPFYDIIGSYLIGDKTGNNIFLNVFVGFTIFYILGCVNSLVYLIPFFFGFGLLGKKLVLWLLNSIKALIF